MKKVLFSLFISSVLLIVGCQENSITNPVSPSFNKNDLTHMTNLQGTIRLDQKLMNSVVGNANFLLDGEISYTEGISQHLGTQGISTLGSGLDVMADISVDAVLKGVNTSSVQQDGLKISSKSINHVFIGKDGSAVLVKTIPILSRTDKLVFTFNVSASGIRLEKVILFSPNM